MNKDPVEWSEASPELLRMARELIRDFHADIEDARVCLVFRSKAQKSANKMVLGKAGKVSERLQPYMPYDFIIWIAEDVFESMDEERQRALVDHELTHCTYRNGKWALRHHDIEEFLSIIDRYGLWTADLISAGAHIAKVTQQELGFLKDHAKGTVGTVDVQEAGKTLADREQEIDHLLDQIDFDEKDAEDDQEAPNA